MGMTEDQNNHLLQLVTLLDKLVGNRVTGYYGSILIKDDLRRLVDVARPELLDLLRFKERMEWLHSGGGITDQEGYEWGVARVKFNQQGQCTDIQWTKSDHSDLDAEMTRIPKSVENIQSLAPDNQK